MRIDLVTTSYPAHAGDPSGHFVQAEARRLARKGHTVRVLAPGRGAEQDPSDDSHERLEVVRLPDFGLCGYPGALVRARERPLRALGALRFVQAARRVLRVGPSSDRIVAHFLLPSAWPIAVDLGVPLEVVAHGSDVRLLCRLPSRLRRRIVRTLLDAGATFRFASAELLEHCAVRTVPALARVSRVEPAEFDLLGTPSREEARQRLQIGPEQRLLLVAGRLVAPKRVHVALNAAELVEKARIVVLGDGPERKDLERRHPGVFFAGLVPRPLALTWLAAADVLLSASEHEGAPCIVREARALGVPVVSSVAGDLALWEQLDPDLYVVGSDERR